MWTLDPSIHHLNHGSFGAVPLPVQEARRRWLDEWERGTTAFVFERMQPALDRSRQVVADFVGGSPDGLVFVRNATTGVASVVRSLEPTWGPGDEIVTTSHDYNAVRQTLAFSAGRTGARLVVVDVAFPLSDPSEVTAAVLAAVGPRTKLVVIDHISSPTGLVFPVADIVSALEPEVPVLVDGAHGPGQVSLDLVALGASWYTGNLHKWVCAPKGSAFLHTRSDWIDRTFPVVISHGWNDHTAPSRYHALFDWLGTDDMTPWLVAPDAIETVGALEAGGWPAVMKLNRDLALAGQEILCERLGLEAPAPPEMVGSMASVILPALGGPPISGMSPVSGDLLSRGFEVPVMVWPEWPGQVLRISAHHYNRLEEYAALAEALAAG